MGFIMALIGLFLGVSSFGITTISGDVSCSILSFRFVKTTFSLFSTEDASALSSDSSANCRLLNVVAGSSFLGVGGIIIGAI